jgi:hypothetical protein
MLEVSKEDETLFPHKETTEAIIGAAFEVYKRGEAQLLNELKATSLKVGVLLNFGRTKVEFRRLIF